MTRDRMQRQRFEWKYVLNESKASAIREFVRAHLELDEAGVGQPDYAYRVNSLYLDSDELYTFWDWVNANRNRFKLRFRFYDPRPDTPVFLEIKRRVNQCILKQRCAILKSAAPLVLAGQFPSGDAILTRDARGLLALENFVRLVRILEARPQALVTYLREAYVDPVNESARVTLDRQVRTAPRTTPDFSLAAGEWVEPFLGRVILELKFTNRFPEWFAGMAQALSLRRGAAAKYCEGMAALRHPEQSNYSAFPGSNRGPAMTWEVANERR